MKLALFTTDNRENFRKYELEKPYFGTAPEALLQGFALIPDIKVHVVSCSQRSMQSPKKLAENIWFHSLHVKKIGWMRTGYQGCIRAVRRKLNEIRPDIVHGQGTERDCCISAIFSGYPNVLTIHGNMRLISKLTRAKPFSFYWINSYLEAFTIPRTAGVVCISNYTNSAVQCLAKKTWIVPNAVDSSFLTVGKNRVISQANPTTLKTTPVILVVGNIEQRKNQNDFIRALDSFVLEKPFQARFFGFCGDSEYARDFRKLVGSRPWCYFGGMIGREELKKEFEKASILALPTHEDNCPMVVLEAMAAGVPVMASKVGGITDLIDGSTTGLFCDPFEPESFRHCIMQFLEDSQLAKRFADAAFKKAFECYHPKVIASRHLQIYKEVLNK
jgi:glycosyltransferase involved in cell wall biosynthesis